MSQAERQAAPTPDGQSSSVRPIGPSSCRNWPRTRDHLVTKQRWGAFLGTTLDEYLRQRGVTQIVLTGIATSIGVESTARSAYDLGYNVALVVDAMTDRDAGAHGHSVEKIFPRLGETTTTDDVLQLLRKTPGTTEPRQSPTG
jgi:nicotinamidase-related amidase